MTAAVTKAAIAEAAAQEFVVHGYAGTSLSRIASRLGHTKGSLVYHFRAKADFLDYFISIVRGATAQADAFSREHYPDSGARRLLLYFLIMGTWRNSYPQFAAGMALFTDSATPAVDTTRVLRDWLTLSADAFRVSSDQGELRQDMSAADMAELFLISNLGGMFFGQQVHRDTAEVQSLRFVQLGLAAVGIPQVHLLAEDVIARHGNAIPALRCLAQSC